MGNIKIHNIRFTSSIQSCPPIKGTILTIGITDGFRIFSLNEVASLELIYDSRGNYREVYCAECHDHVIFFVEYRLPCYFVVFNFIHRRQIKKLKFNEHILNFKIDKNLILIRLTNSLHVLNAENYEVIKVIANVETASSALAIFTNTSTTQIAYPSVPNIGSLTVCRVTLEKGDARLETINVTKPCDKEIAQIEFNLVGNQFAVTSIDGVYIYVVDVDSGDILHHFLRGIYKNAKITSFLFVDDKYLICSSDSDTIHIFEMTTHVSMIGSYMTSAISYLPYSSSLITQRSTIGLKIPSQGFDTRVYTWKHSGLNWMAVASYSGGFYVFIFDVDDKQCIKIDCNLLKVGANLFSSCHEDSSLLTGANLVFANNKSPMLEINSLITEKRDTKNEGCVRMIVKTDSFVESSCSSSSD